MTLQMARASGTTSMLDLARGHLSALSYLERHQGLHIWNLGTGTGTSIKELVDKVREVTGVEIKTEITSRRLGDSSKAVADPQKAKANYLGIQNIQLGICALITGIGNVKIQMGINSLKRVQDKSL